MMSGHGPRGNEVIKGKTIKVPKHTPQTFNGLIHGLGSWIGPMRIIVGSPCVLDVVVGFEPLEALCPGVVDILGIADELRRRRRSVGSRHFNVEDRLMV